MKKIQIVKIVSGGQTGADRGGLEAAIDLNIPHGGWCPKGRKAEDGVIPMKYNMQELDNYRYIKRTEKNVVDSTATVIFCYGMPEGGSYKTVKFAEKYSKPFLIINMNMPYERNIDILTGWVRGLEGCKVVLNIAGSRGSTNPALENDVCKILKYAINKLSL